MRKERKHFTPEEKVAILRRHLVDKVPVSELCEELGLRPTVFYRWQKELFENGAAAFQSQERPHRQVEEKQKQCPASSILSGQRQLDFPMLFEIPAAVGAVGKVGIARVVRDFQGRWEGRKTCFWFSSLSTARLFPQPFGRRVCVVKEIIEGHFASADSKPASRFFLACSMR